MIHKLCIICELCPNYFLSGKDVINYVLDKKICQKEGSYHGNEKVR